jgi:chaperonin GroES
MIEQPKQSGLIHIPDSAVDAPQYATVLALGDLVTADLEVGDEVSFGKYSGHILKRNNKEYLVIMESDILAKVKRD